MITSLHLFYSTQHSDTNIVLENDEANHCRNVLRLRVGDLVNVINGKGTKFTAKIISSDKKGVFLEIIEKTVEKQVSLHQLHIAIAPTKNIDRIEWFVEKAVEIGIQEISFLQTKRTERKQINIERIEKIAISAMKQSLKVFLPKIHELISYDLFLKNVNQIPHTNKFIAHLIEDQERKMLKKELVSSQKNESIILIGPEGDFTSEEVNLAIIKGFIPISLGEAKLRTETAGLVACHTFSLLLT
jgi:16S rRNA (uracil1498-N3)-methyltransferase